MSVDYCLTTASMARPQRHHILKTYDTEWRVIYLYTLVANAIASECAE